MDSLLSFSATDASPLSFDSASLSDSKASIDTFLIQSSASSSSKSDKVGLDFSELYKNLSITGHKIIDKLNELLKTQLPDGIQSLKPEDVTAEATAERIVRGSTSFFDIFAKQNPNLSDEELLDKFMETIRGGIQTGYDDAFNILEGLGAFEFDGVKSGIEQTKILIEQKLVAFYELKKKELGIVTDQTESLSPPTTDGYKANGVSGSLNLTV